MNSCMIVDDSSIIRKVARRIIEKCDCVAFDAMDGDEALELCRGRMPDVIIVDWMMPRLSGIEFIEEFKRKFGDSAKNTLLVYCTNEMDLSSMTKAKRAGATHFLMKPFDQQILMKKLAEVGIVPIEKAA